MSPTTTPLRVLVTGGNGRLGRSVLGALAQAGHQPISVDVSRAEAGGAWESFPADLTQPGEAYAAIARYRPDAVVHLAAVAVPFSRSEHAIYTTNTALAFNVLQASVDLGVGRVVVASSPTVIGYGNPSGWVPRYLPLDEEHPTEPWNAYSLSKLGAETAMKMFAARSDGNTRFAAFRPCFVVAPEDWAGAPTQDGRTIRERLDRPALAAASLFNYLDARDAGEFVTVLVERLEAIPDGEVFFVGAEDALVEEPLAVALRKHAGVPDGVDVRTDPLSSSFSIDKARRLLDWKPRHTWRAEARP